MDSLKPRSIFLVEDSDEARMLIAALVKGLPGYKVVGQAATGQEAITGVLASRPDVVLMDIGLPDISGIEVTHEIRKTLPEVQVIMLTAHDTNELMFKSFAAGAEGYILKLGITIEKLGLAIDTVLTGNIWIDPLLARRVLQFAAGQFEISDHHNDAHHDVEPLTVQEKEVLEEATVGSEGLCAGGVCGIDPSFLMGLQRFGKSKASAG